MPRQFFLNNSYSPARFIIKLDWDQEMPKGNTYLDFDTPALQSLFIHEYIHFLQEISTAYGRMKTSCMLMSALQRSHQMRIANESVFNVPIEFDQNACDEVLFFNEKVSPLYAGSPFIQGLRNVGVYIRSLKPTNCSISGRELRYLTSDIETSNGQKFEITIGGEILSESMAYLAEANIIGVNGITSPPSQYPYLMVNKMAKILYPEIADNNLLLYKIVDLCLSKAYNPGIAFYDFLKFLKKEKFSDASDDCKLISLFESQLPQSHPLSTIADEVIREISQCFQSDYFSTTIQWLQELYSRADFLRLCDPLFMKEFYAPDGISPVAKRFIERVFGYPYIINEGNESIWKPPHNFKFNLRQNIEFHLLAAAIEIGHTLKTASPCRLRMFCKVSPDPGIRSIVNGVCQHPCDKLTELKATPSKRLCPFAAMWKHWGLDGKTISSS